MEKEHSYIKMEYSPNDYVKKGTLSFRVDRRLLDSASKWDPDGHSLVKEAGLASSRFSFFLD